MKFVPAMLLLVLASIVPARAATCPQEIRLRADPRWTPGKGNNCHLCVFNLVAVGPDSLLRWNGGAVTEARLADYLGLGANLAVPPVTLLRIEDGADCALLARVVAAIEAHGDCGAGEHCGFGLEIEPPPPRR